MKLILKMCIRDSNKSGELKATFKAMPQMKLWINLHPVSKGSVSASANILSLRVFITNPPVSKMCIRDRY